MQRTVVIFMFFLSIGMVSCKSSKNARKPYSKVIIDKRTDKSSTESSEENYNNDNSNIKTAEPSGNITHDIINYAKQFQGVKYKWGGTTNAGMDCSGLVFESFRAYGIILPRISRDMAKQGDKISLKETLKGDLLFFKTKNRRNDINHVGLVVAIENNAIYFIHATTHEGVIISSLNESYWKNAFAEVRRIL